MTYKTRSLDDIPEDVWIYIIKTYITYYDGLEIQVPHMVVDRLLPLMLVSKRWDLRIQAIPTLWTDLVVNDDIEDLETKFAICLHFSRNAPISLIFVGKSRSWSYLSLIFVPERSRISSIALTYEADPFPVGGRISSILAELSPLPALRSLRCNPGSYFRFKVEYFESSPMLSNMEGCYLQPTELNRTPQTLQTLCVDMAPGPVLPFLGRFNLLKSVGFFYSAVYTGSDDHNYSTTINDGQLNWTDLTCYWFVNRSHIGLLSRLRSSLINLTIIVDVDEGLMEFLRSLGGLSQLRDCEIQIRGSSVDRELGIVANDGIINPSCPATKLNFSLSVHDFERDKLEAVASTLQACLPMIQELNISGTTCEDAFSLLSGRGFHKLRTLSVNSPYYTDEALLNQLVTNLPSSLNSISTDLPMQILDSFMTPWVEAIYYRGHTGELKISQLNKWMGLRSLRISTSDLAYWDGFSSHSLRKLIYHDNSDSTHLFHHFAMYPISCPSLEYLEVSRIPDWDIFFIMLERRNLEHRDVVSPLKHIVLPELCPRYLRRPIRQLLQGEIPIRPSYYNLSRQRIWEDVKQSKVSGCIACLRSLRYCEQAINAIRFKVHTEISFEYVGYPSDPDEILSTRLSRQYQLPRIEGRKNRCSKWLMPSLTNITEDSIEERTCDWGEEELLQFLYPEDFSTSK